MSANIQFWRSAIKTDSSFLDLVSRNFKQTFLTPSSAVTWLNSNGYYTSYPTNNVTTFGYGYLYNWYAVTGTSTQSIAASNAYVPSTTDFNTLITYIGGLTSGGKLKATGTTYWSTPNTSATDDYGFSMYGNGSRASSFFNKDLYGHLWSTNSISSTQAYVLITEYNTSNVYTGTGGSALSKYQGSQVRLIIITPNYQYDANTGVYIGNDGTHYKCVLIGTQWWLAEGLVETKYRDGTLIPEITDGNTWSGLTSGARCSYNNDSSISLGPSSVNLYAYNSNSATTYTNTIQVKNLVVSTGLTNFQSLTPYAGPDEKKGHIICSTNSDGIGTTLNLKVLLGGAHIGGGIMRTGLTALNLIPLNQPYWAFSAVSYTYYTSKYYKGSESVGSIPANVVDWILVELRQAPVASGATFDKRVPRIGQSSWVRACFLKKDGTVVDLDGTSQLKLGNCLIDTSLNLYVVIHHRNHLSIMSSSGMTLSSNTYSYDFTTAVSNAYNNGQNGTTYYTMISGDLDGDNSNTVNDSTAWSINFGRTNVYILADADLDGQVSVTDTNLYNFGLDSYVPK